MRKQTKTMTLLLVFLITSAFALAQTQSLSTSATKPYVEKEMSGKIYDPANFPTPRQGGNTIGEAVTIPSLPYSNSGTTSGYTNNYDEVCPFTGSTSPDVVYAFTPTVDVCVDIDLCGSGYDTKLYVYENAYTPGAPFACNDDYYSSGDPCGSWVSALLGLGLTAGNTYYIVIDGYGSESGEYELAVTECPAPPPPFECPPGTIAENEPCGLNLNGGCNDPDGGNPIEAVNLGDIICGTTWATGIRDTDWFVLELDSPTDLVLNAQVEIPMYFFWLSIDPPCDADLLESLAVPAGGSGSMVLGVLPPGTYYFWAGPQSYEGYPCENVYYLEFEGNIPPVPLKNWALYIGILLMVTFIVIRFRRMM